MATVEEMLGKTTINEKYLPRDAVGNVLNKGDLVCIGFNNMGPIMGRVTDVTPGGIKTPEGTTFTKTTVIFAFTLPTGPEGRLPQILKAVNPVSDAIMNELIKRAPSE